MVKKFLAFLLCCAVLGTNTGTYAASLAANYSETNVETGAIEYTDSNGSFVKITGKNFNDGHFELVSYVNGK